MAILKGELSPRGFPRCRAGRGGGGRGEGGAGLGVRVRGDWWRGTGYTWGGGRGQERNGPSGGGGDGVEDAVWTEGAAMMEENFGDPTEAYIVK